MSNTKVISMLLWVMLSSGLAKAQNIAYLNQDLKVAPKSAALSQKNQSKRDFTQVPEARFTPTPVENRLDEKFRDDDINKYYPRKGTQSFVNIYLGLTNYLQNGDLPGSNDIITLNPLSSWYGSFNFDHVSHIVGPVYLDWGIGVSIQEFSFENTRVEVVLDRDAQTVDFVERIDRVGKKSKINMMHLNLHFVPTFSFGKNDSFRIGAGVYGGYRISSHTKYKYDDLNGDGQKDKFKDSLFINPFRYGLRAQMGWNSFDIFFNYDLSELFEEEALAPRLNPVTFGVIF